MLNANRMSTNVIVTVLVMLLVFVLPLVDRRICTKLGLNLHHGVSTNPKADALLQIRQLILFAVFFVYVMVFAYLVFFSRTASEEYLVHIAPFVDLQNAISTDYGLSDLLVTLFRGGIQEAFSHVYVLKFEDIAQVYMNIMLYVPMGYLLPYVFEFFRSRSGIRPVLACFVISFITENLQLIFRRGFYDMDDLLRRADRAAAVHRGGLRGDAPGLAQRAVHLSPLAEGCAAQRPLPLCPRHQALPHHPARHRRGRGLFFLCDQARLPAPQAADGGVLLRHGLSL